VVVIMRAAAERERWPHQLLEGSGALGGVPPVGAAIRR